MPFQFHFGGFDPSGFGGFQGGGDGGFTPPQRSQKARKPRRAIGNAFTRTLLNLGVTVLFGLGYFYAELPAINLHERSFMSLRFCSAPYTACARCSPPASRGTASRDTRSL